MNDEQILKILEPVDGLWNKIQSTEANSAWHGYGWHEEKTILVVRPFVEKKEELPRIEDAIRAVLPGITVKGLVMPRFRARNQEQQGDRRKSKNMLEELSPPQPGDAVFSFRFVLR